MHIGYQLWSGSEAQRKVFSENADCAGGPKPGVRYPVAPLNPTTDTKHNRPSPFFPTPDSCVAGDSKSPGPRIPWQ